MGGLSSERRRLTQQIEHRIQQMKSATWLLLIGTALAIGAFITSGSDWAIGFGVLACLSMLPFFFFAVMIPVWHWKHCYRGKHDELWGALLILETSGWFKIIYWFRHVRPDMKRRGRYINRNNDEPSPPVAMM
jgi:hypothetical protein